MKAAEASTCGVWVGVGWDGTHAAGKKNEIVGPRWPLPPPASSAGCQRTYKGESKGTQGTVKGAGRWTNELTGGSGVMW